MAGGKRPIPDALWATLTAAGFAQQIGLPPGNLWEPGIARQLEQALATASRDEVLAEYRIRFELDRRR